MVFFKGKSTTNRLATSPRGVKNRVKVYSDLEKVQDENAMRNVEKQVMSLRKSLPVRKGTQLTDLVDVLKVYDESSKHDTSVQSKAGRKALADVSNVKHSSLRTGVTKGSKAVKSRAHSATADAQWYSREEVRNALTFAEYKEAQKTAAIKVDQMCKGVEKGQNLSADYNVESGELAAMFIPGPFAIAHHLISSWVNQGTAAVTDMSLKESSSVSNL